MSTKNSEKVCALVLMGGGARAAYQVGVIAGINEVIKDYRSNPFHIIIGTSAGALNAGMLASHTREWQKGVRELENFWMSMSSEKIFEVRGLRVALGGFKWVTLFALGWLFHQKPKSLLDNSALANTLKDQIDFSEIDRGIQDGCLKTFAVTSSSYSSGLHWTFYQSKSESTHPKVHVGRKVAHSEIGVSHLLASSSIPFIFPAEPISIDGNYEYFGDGSLRQSAPLSPAIHFGAEKILVIGCDNILHRNQASSNSEYPSISSIAGHALSSVFYSALDADIEHSQHITKALDSSDNSPHMTKQFTPVSILHFAPSKPISRLAEKHVQHFPKPIHNLLKVLGATKGAGAMISSYLLFEKPFIEEVINLGKQDALVRADEIIKFFTEKSE